MSEATALPRPPKSSATHFHVPTWVAVVVGGIVVLVAGFAIGRASDGGDGRGFADRAGRFGDHPGVRLLGLFVFVFLIALVVAGVVLLVRHFSSQTRPSSAEELLGERLAAGEIDEEEYRRRRDALRS
jgi:putative membrane protein